MHSPDYEVNPPDTAPDHQAAQVSRLWPGTVRQLKSWYTWKLGSRQKQKRVPLPAPEIHSHAEVGEISRSNIFGPGTRLKSHPGLSAKPAYSALNDREVQFTLSVPDWDNCKVDWPKAMGKGWGGTRQIVESAGTSAVPDWDRGTAANSHCHGSHAIQMSGPGQGARSPPYDLNHESQTEIVDGHRTVHAGGP
jgi:hypothetical protein